MVLRWLLFLPIAAAAWCAVGYGLGFVYALIEVFYPDKAMQGWASQLVESAVSAYVFVTVGSRIAPTGRAVVAAVMTALLCVWYGGATLIGTVLVVEGGTHPLWRGFNGIVALVVGVVATLQVHVLDDEAEPIE